MQLTAIGRPFPDARYIATEGARLRFYETSFEFTAEFSFDAPANGLKLPDLEAWLPCEFNLVQFTLVEQKTGVVKAMRGLGVRPELVQAFKDVLREQAQTYKKASEVDSATNFITARMGTEQMLRSPLAQKQKF